MLFQRTILPNNANIGIWKIEESVDQLSSLLSKQSLADSRFESLKNEMRKLEWLSSRLLIKILCGEEKTIVYNKAGKPIIADNSFKISISHTNNYVAVILHPTLNVGIDIEKISNRVLKLKEKFMSALEIEAINKSKEKEYILLHWSAKETLFKILPESEISFIDQLHIKPFKIKEEGNFEAYETRTGKKQKFTMQYKVFDDFVLTWTTK